MIKIANNKINKIMLGNDEIVKVYLGNDLIYQNKKWVFQQAGHIYPWSTSKETLDVNYGRYLIYKKQGNTIFTYYMAPDYGGLRKNLTIGVLLGVLNADMLIFEKGRIQVYSGSFNPNTKTFKPSSSRPRKEAIDTSYMYIEITGSNNEPADFELYKLE